MDEPNKGNVAGCGSGSEATEIAYHYTFKFGISADNHNKTFTFIVDKAYDGAYMVMDGKLAANATWMKDGDRVYTQCVLSEGMHTIELYALAFNDDPNPVWTYAVDGSEEMALTLPAINAYCPVVIKYPTTESCSLNTVLMPTKPTRNEGYLAKGKMVIWSMKMRDMQKIEVKTTGSKDIDLYIRWNDCPTTDTWNSRGFSTSSVEREVFAAPEDGIVYIGVRGFTTSDYTMATTCDGEAKMCQDLWTPEQAASWNVGNDESIKADD